MKTSESSNRSKPSSSQRGSSRELQKAKLKRVNSAFRKVSKHDVTGHFGEKLTEESNAVAEPSAYLIMLGFDKRNKNDLLQFKRNASKEVVAVTVRN